MYLPGPHLLDQFPVASHAVCARVRRKNRLTGETLKIPQIKTRQRMAVLSIIDNFWCHCAEQIGWPECSEELPV